MGKKNKEKKRKGGGHTLYALTVLTLAVAIIAMSVLLLFHVQTIEISGNKYVESRAIAKSIQSDKYATNTLYIMIKNACGKIHYPQSVESAKVRMKTPWSIKVLIQEKKPVACTLIRDDYILFDEEGVVLGMMQIQPEGIPFVEGMYAGKIEVNKPLAVREKRVFRNIVDLTEAFAQYAIEPTRIECDGADMTVHIGDVCVELGSGDMELKVNQLPDILEKLKGKKGTLDLKYFKDSTEIISFKEEDPKSKEDQQNR